MSQQAQAGIKAVAVSAFRVAVTVLSVGVSSLPSFAVPGMNNNMA